MAAYRLTSTNVIVRTADGAAITPDPANRDYIAYQAWLAAGNTPDAYVPPVIVQATPTPQPIPALTAHPTTPPATGSVTYTVGGQTFIQSANRTITGVGDP